MKNFTRTEAENLIEKQGGTTSSSVTSKTNYVLLGENPGSKFDKAKKLGITIITEDDFIKMLNLEQKTTK